MIRESLTAMTAAVLSIPGDACGAGLPGSDAFFCFPDSAGARVIIVSLEELEVPPEMCLVMPDGGTRRLGPAGRSEGTGADTFRDLARNFDNRPGYVFEVTGDPVDPGLAGIMGSTLVAISPDALEDLLPLPVERLDPEPLDEAVLSEIESYRGLAVLDSWRLALVGSAAEVDVVLFEPVGLTWTGSVVLRDCAGPAYRDYVGQLPPLWGEDPPPDCVNEEDYILNSVWRVDDCGRFDSGLFDVVAAFSSGSGLLIAVTWAGAEGENASLLLRSGDLLVEEAAGYRYWSPL